MGPNKADSKQRLHAVISPFLPSSCLFLYFKGRIAIRNVHFTSIATPLSLFIELSIYKESYILRYTHKND